MVDGIFIRQVFSCIDFLFVCDTEEGLFWFFGDFKCGVPFFIVIHITY